MHSKPDADASKGEESAGEADPSADASKDKGHGKSMGTIRGLTESQTIFGGNVLAMASVMARDGAPSKDDWQLPDDPSKLMRSLSYFSFDPASSMFSAVFMSDMDGTMHYASGKYDTSSRSIVFEAADDRSGRSDRAEAVDAAAPGSSSQGRRQETAVLELVEDNTFQVTMYLGEAAQKANSGNLDGIESKPEGREGLGSNVLYRATYCRATAEREKACREAMREDRRRQEQASGM